MKYRISGEMRLFLLGVAGACILAVLITVIVMLSSGRHAQPTAPPAADLAGSLQGLDLSSFQVPNSYTEVFKQSWYPSRAQEKRWSWTEVQRFWLDPRKSAIKSISEENDKKLNELFKGVQ